jgi:hypothetical protein
MKRPWKGIRSARHFVAAGMPPAQDTDDVASNNTILIPNDDDPEVSIDNMPMPVSTHTNVIANDDDSDANVFVFAAFADKQTRTLYSDLTGAFPFMSLEGNVCCDVSLRDERHHGNAHCKFH